MIEKPKGAKFDVGGVLYDKVRLTMVLDGYTAPVTAGTIVDLIQRGEKDSSVASRGFRKGFGVGVVTVVFQWASTFLGVCGGQAHGRSVSPICQPEAHSTIGVRVSINSRWRVGGGEW